MIPNEVFTHQIESGHGQQPVHPHRRTFIGGALGALFASPVRMLAEDTDAPSNPFIVLLKGVYQPVPLGQGPASNLGLTTVNLSSGSFSKTQIYAVFGISDSNNDDNHEGKAIGTFYVGAGHCAYDLPGGAIAMRFLPAPAGAPPGFNGFVPFPDGMGGTFLEGTFELTILEATGIYQAFAAGHNHMVDRLHQLANGSRDEFCFCVISQYQFP